MAYLATVKIRVLSEHLRLSEPESLYGGQITLLTKPKIRFYCFPHQGSTTVSLETNRSREAEAGVVQREVIAKLK